MSETSSAPAQEAGNDRFTVTDYSGATEATPAPEPAAESTPPGEGEPPAQAETTEEPAASEPNADDPSAEEPDEPKKARGGFQKRISELTAARSAAERQVEALTHTVRELSARLQVPTQQQPPAQPGTAPAAPQLPPDLAAQVGPAPNPADFSAGEFDPAYTEAKIMHRLKTEQAKVVLQQRAQAQQQQQAEVQQKVRDLITEGNNRHADFEEVALSDKLPMPPQMVHALTECDEPSEVAYWLGKNPDEARRIASLPATKIARELAKVEAKLANPPAPKPSAAPAPPPPPIRGRGAVAKSVYDADLSYQDYVRLRQGK